MQLSLKSFVAAAVLTLASTSVLAQVTVPPQPGAPPVPNTDSGNGGLIVSIWDATRNVSVTQYLGLTLDQLLASGGTSPTGGPMTPTGGLSLNFGEIDQFDAIFGASSATNIRYTVFAGDNTADGGGTFLNRRVASTLNAPASGIVNIANDRIVNVANAGRDFINAVNAAYAADAGAGDTCAAGGSCAATSSGVGYYAGRAQWGQRYSNQFNVDAGGLVNNAFAFYLLTTTSNTPTSSLATAFRNGPTAQNIGRWLLSDAGVLTYSIAPVPLPAALWLLLSGLTGLGVVSRRRGAPATAAA